MRRINKKASLETKEILELILAAAAIVLVIVFFAKFFSPKQDINKEAAKSFFETLSKAVAEAESKGKAQMQLWGDGNIFIVYFGEKNVVKYARPARLYSSRPLFNFINKPEIDKSIFSMYVLFTTNNKYKHAICVCYTIDKVTKVASTKYLNAKCEYCLDLKKDINSYGVYSLISKAPIKDIPGSSDWFVIEPRSAIKLVKTSDNKYDVAQMIEI